MSPPMHNTRLSKSATASKKSPVKNILMDNLDICPICGNSVKSEEKGLCCEECHQWWHSACCNIDDEKYEWLASSSNVLFVCDNCKDSRNRGESLSTESLFTQMQAMINSMNATLAIHEKMIKSNNELASRVTKLEKQGTTSGVGEEDVKKIVEESVTNILDAKAEEIMRDVQERDARKLNLIVANLPENLGEDSKKKDEEVVNGLMKKILPGEEVKIEETTRLGKVNLGNRPRFVKIKVQSMEMKKKILKHSAKINEGTGVTDPRQKLYINMDYTKKEREINKALRDELKSKPAEEREKYQIRFGKLVLKDDPSKDGSSVDK